MTRVLVADKLADEAADILRDAGIDVDVRPGRAEEEILSDITQYDGVIVRSATTITRRIIDAGTNLRVIGRAGVGFDNIDVASAKEHGVVVMNTPLGNIISAAEHTVAMILALARNIPAAHGEVVTGVWNRSAHTGVELENKTLGIVGLGKIGQHVGRVAKALNMHVIAFDPYMNAERGRELGIELTDLEALLARSDFITLHVPKTVDTAGMIDADAIAKMKASARVVNVARGGIVDEQALADALRDGRIAGAAIDVFSYEPIAPDNPLLGAPNAILTPHLGASTIEAQTKVAEAIARQFVAFFSQNIIQNAVNLDVHLPPGLAPYARLAEVLGSIAAQLSGRQAVRTVRVAFHGRVAEGETRALAVSALSGVLQHCGATTVNLVNAEDIAASRGMDLVEERSRHSHGYLSLVRVEAVCADGGHRVSGTCFDDTTPRIVEIDGMAIDLRPADTILVMRYGDRPGMVGRFGTVLGNAGINIACMEVGRSEKGAEALVALTLDDPVPPDVRAELRDVIDPTFIEVISL